jgi:hypothetical protein
MRLYKYVIPDRIDVLQNASIRFTPAAAMNDPFEVRPMFEAFDEDEVLRHTISSNMHEAFQQEVDSSVIATTLDDLFNQLEDVFAQVAPGEEVKKELGEMRKALPPPDIFWTESKQRVPSMVNTFMEIMNNNMPIFRNVVLTEFATKIGMLCLAGKCNNLLMWAHYANNYKGFVIEFNGKHRFFCRQRHAPEELGGLKKVRYTDIRPNKSLLIGLTAEEIFLTKSKKWKYEQEWRMLASFENEEDKCLKIDGKPVLDGDGLPIFLCPLPHDCITGVIFGSRMTEENKLKIANILSDDARYSHVKIYQSVLDERAFKLHTVPVS